MHCICAQWWLSNSIYTNPGMVFYLGPFPSDRTILENRMCSHMRRSTGTARRLDDWTVPDVCVYFVFR